MREGQPQHACSKYLGKAAQYLGKAAQSKQMSFLAHQIAGACCAASFCAARYSSWSLRVVLAKAKSLILLFDEDKQRSLHSQSSTFESLSVILAAPLHVMKVTTAWQGGEEDADTTPACVRRPSRSTPAQPPLFISRSIKTTSTFIQKQPYLALFTSVFWPPGVCGTCPA
ncbi:hypothetical protein GQ43DRAFT_264460 [Delitschia confertaspora ATCC 74209]|uniref:Uncharacterized protein n=1 Tax=Delitschia confertaspora ATCC 74209 TaxID=1513339 RepID=A0A9P4MTN9_9PLEO|nr:hypothetical protein GQ43DRAFT_264460 [Delitschia confertaspora ATCC 74209]